MNVIRCTVVDGRGAVSFIVHGDALPALAASCSTSPASLEELLERAEPYYHSLRDYVLNGLAMFEERNSEGNCEAIDAVLQSVEPHQHPVFRVVDDLTRETSLQPVKAGAIIFNLQAKRIVQIINVYWEIQRTGCARVFDGHNLTNTVYKYRLPEEWALVP